MANKLLQPAKFSIERMQGFEDLLAFRASETFLVEGEDGNRQLIVGTVQRFA